MPMNQSKMNARFLHILNADLYVLKIVCLQTVFPYVSTCLKVLFLHFIVSEQKPMLNRIGRIGVNY